jgi:predicted anti-sigma-YlaC factor YlaD
MNDTDELSCKEVVGLVTDYLEQALLPQTQEQLEKHLADCPGCTTYLQQIQQTISMLRMLAEEPTFPAHRADLLLMFERWKRGPAAPPTSAPKPQM